MNPIVLEGVSKVFAGGVRAVDHVDLEIESGEFMVLVGPSGCGKTTLLRMIAGLESVTEGRILIGDRDVTGQLPRDRDIAMVFQSYALYPHMTVEKNLGYGLKARRMEKAEAKRRVTEVAHMLGLENLLERRPSALSGGQRQRVAMGRAIVREPAAFLMDEPLSNLDAKLRVGMRGELARLHERLGVTTVYVTHDQVEAMTLGQRVAVMRNGLLQQVDTPQGLYHRPANLFVASFIGSPSMNLVEAIVREGHVEFGGFRVPLHDPATVPSGTVILGVRPQNFEAADLADPSLPTIEVKAMVVEDLGSELHVLFSIDAPPVDIEAVHTAASEEDEEEAMLIVEERRARFTAVVSSAASVRTGSPLRLAVDTSQFRYFDPNTGEVVAREGIAAA